MHAATRAGASRDVNKERSKRPGDSNRSLGGLAPNAGRKLLERAHSAGVATLHGSPSQVLVKAEAFVRAQKTMLRRRQLAMQDARGGWRRSVEALESIAAGEQRELLQGVLRQARLSFTCLPT